MSWGPKGERKTTNGTGGMPTTLKGQGNRGTEVLTLGRVPETSVRSFSTVAGSPSTVLTDSQRKIQKINKLCEDDPNFVVKDELYQLLYDKRLYHIAYDKLKSKPGNMTPGITPTTMDGMSDEVIESIVGKLKNGTFQFQPGRRVHIPKPSGGQRPLTIAPPRDKMVQECIRMILEAIFEPSFKDTSHGFRPNRSCHTALKVVRQRFIMAK
jgi:retron-type reverse transcriptase